MNLATWSLFFALLGLIALAGAVALVVLLVVARRGGVASGAERLRLDLGRAALPLAWVVATVTTLGSLYYSEMAHFTPCKLCWYQRIAMYPLVLLLGIASVRRDRSVRPYVIAQCAVGVCISVYHSFIQAFPPESGTSFCTVDAPCTERYVWEFGFVSLPFLAFCGFVAIIALMLVAGPSRADATASSEVAAGDAGDADDAGGPTAGNPGLPSDDHLTTTATPAGP